MNIRKLVFIVITIIAMTLKAQTTPTIYQDDSKNGIVKNCQYSGQHHGHDWVDLGLPSGTLWATTNVGASQPGDYGSYFAFGENSVKSEYRLGTYKYYSSNFFFYGASREYLIDADDAAKVQWGWDWRTPTPTECNELLNTNYCSISYTTQNNKNLLLIKSKTNGNFIYLPMAGYCYDSYKKYDSENYGFYWTNHVIPDSPAEYAQCICLTNYNEVKKFGVGSKRRDKGCSVRPVCSSSAIEKFALILNCMDGGKNNQYYFITTTTTTITAVPKSDYHFLKWSDGDTSNPRTITVSANVTYTAMFAPNKCKITTSTTNGIVSGAGTYDYNTNVTLTATPDEHYHFVKWSDGNTSNPRTITATKDSTFTAVFALDQHTIKAINGQLTITGSGTYYYGATATLTVINNDCYSFQKWSDGNTDNPRQILVTQDSTFTVNYIGVGYQETVNCTVVNESPYGTVSFTGTVIKDSNISLKAMAPECSQFVKWSDNDTSNPRNLTITQDSTLTAIFEKIQFNVSINTSDSIKGKVKMEESLP